MTETQVLMTSIFLVVFLGIISWKGLHFSIQLGVALFLNGGRAPQGGIRLMEGSFKKKLWVGRGCLPIRPCYGKPWLAALKIETPLQVFSCEF